MPLMGVDLVTELVQTIILTGRLRQDGPISLLLIASPESGKTSVVLERPCKAIIPLSDVTGKGLQHLCKQTPEVSHFVINDMVAVMSHKVSVNHFTLAMINSMTEEGIMATAYPDGFEKYANGKRGVMACLTLDLAKDGRCWWNKTGFATRMLPFAFDHSRDLQIKIKAAIRDGAYENRPRAKEFRIPGKPVNVIIGKQAARQIQNLSEMKATELQEKGYRRAKQFRAVSRAHALLRGSRTVGELDIAFLKRVFPYVSFSDCRTL